MVTQVTVCRNVLNGYLTDRSFTTDRSKNLDDDGEQCRDCGDDNVYRVTSCRVLAQFRRNISKGCLSDQNRQEESRRIEDHGEPCYKAGADTTYAA